MAKIMLGSLAGAVSGSVGNTTYSHNRYGAYIRERIIPTKRITHWTAQAKAQLIAASKAYGALQEADRKAWETWAAGGPVVDRLGAKQILDPHAAYVSVNARILRMGGAMIDVPSASPPPSLPAITGVTYDLGTPGCKITWTGGALGASEHLWIALGVTAKAGLRYWENLLKLVTVSGAAATSPADIEGDMIDRFGSLAVGQVVVGRLYVADDESGLLSAPYELLGVVVSTP